MNTTRKKFRARPVLLQYCQKIPVAGDPHFRTWHLLAPSFMLTAVEPTGGNIPGARRNFEKLANPITNARSPAQ